MADLKLVNIATVRQHMDAHFRDEISYSRAVELINRDANEHLRKHNILNDSLKPKCRICGLPIDNGTHQICLNHDDDEGLW